MAASTSSSENRATGGAERFRLIRRIGLQQSTWAAIETLPDSRTRLVIVDKAERTHASPGGDAGQSKPMDPQLAAWVVDVRRLATLEHPNVSRVRNVIIGAEEVLVAGEYLDGATWSDIEESSAAVSIEIALRVLVDVLSGLSAVHNLRDAKREPLKLVHGALFPGSVVVGLDGIARVTGVARARTDESPDPRISAYLAPEVLLGDDTADARADVYSAGVMLWEALSGRALFADVAPSAIVTHVLGGRVPPASVPEGAPWTEPLVGATARALAADPAKRFASAAAFAAEIRRVAAARLAPPVRVAGLVRATFGDAVRARREKLERGEATANEVAQVSAAAIDLIDSGQRFSALPTPVPPAPTADTVPPPPLPAAKPRQGAAVATPAPAPAPALAPAPAPAPALAAGPEPATSKAEPAPPAQSGTVRKSNPAIIESIEPEPGSTDDVVVPKPPPLPKSLATPATPSASQAPLVADASVAPPAAPRFARRSVLLGAGIGGAVLVVVVLLAAALTRSGNTGPSTAATTTGAATTTATMTATATATATALATATATSTPTPTNSTTAAGTDSTAAPTSPQPAQPTTTATATVTAPATTFAVPAWPPRKPTKPRYDPSGI